MKTAAFGQGIFRIATAMAMAFFLLPSGVSAAQTSFVASVLSVSAPTILAAGETAQVLIKAQNIGSSVWENSGKNYVSIYRYDADHKREVASVFASPSWIAPEQPVILPMARVKKGESVDFAFAIKAPSKAGLYHEVFMLTAENAAWMPNGKFSFDITVKDVDSVRSVSSDAARYTDVSVGIPTSRLDTLHATRQPWAAELIDLGGIEWQIDAGEHVTVTLAFKNTGTKTWTQDGGMYVSLYAASGKKERTSAFKDFSWTAASRAGRLKEKQVKPGDVGHIILELRAPNKPGVYQETFQLAAEDAAWIDGGALTLPIRVPTPSEFIATAPPTDMDPFYSPTHLLAYSTSHYRTTLLLRSAQELTLVGNARQDITLGFKNTGDTAWTSKVLRAKEVRLAAVEGSSTSLAVMRDASWASASEPVNMQSVTKSGEIGFLTFRIKAPSRAGTYRASFVLFADGNPVEGGNVDIPITVTSDGDTPDAALPSAPLPSAVPIVGDFTTLLAEPMIRVGLFKTTDDRMSIRAKYAPVNVMLNGVAYCRLAVGQMAIVEYLRGEFLYRLSGDACAGQSTEPYLFIAEDGVSPMEIADFSRPVAWLPGANDNTFRRQLELRFVAESGNVWVINELPFESYLNGISETSDSSPQEYQRALLTAARTYAYYHIKRNTKHGGVFHVDASFDQVYRGYGAEARDPNVMAAVAATHGQIVTYNGALAITPYYSRSDGRTRAWGEVWYGGSRYPWLVSVPVPWDNGKTLWGHGVGMSASGALGMAKDGKRYDEILRYFYQGTELRRAY